MKICVISSTVFPSPPVGYAGLEMITWHQAEGLAKRGHEVSLIAPEGSRCDHATVIPTGKPGSWDERTAYNSFWKELRRFDVILDSSWQKWAYMLKAEGVLAAPVLGVCHAPVNTMWQSLPPVEKPCVVCISKDQAAHFESLFERPARAAFNGVDTDFYKSTGAKRNGRFLFLGRFSSLKGPDLAIEACGRVGAELDLIGDTSITGEPQFFEQCSRACDGQRIKIVGPASRGECVNWFSKNYCFLHPTMRFREPYGLAPVEAQACGMPVIGWKRGALPETVVDGETGWLVSSIDELTARVLQVKESGISQITRDRCRENADRFTIHKMITRYEELCVEALDTGGW